MGAIILHLFGADKYNSLRARQGDTATRETDRGKKTRYWTKHQKTRKQKTSRAAAAAEVTVITAWTQQRGEAGQSIPGRRAGPDLSSAV